MVGEVAASGVKLPQPRQNFIGAGVKTGGDIVLQRFDQRLRLGSGGGPRFQLAETGEKRRQPLTGRLQGFPALSGGLLFIFRIGGRIAPPGFCLFCVCVGAPCGCRGLFHGLVSFGFLSVMIPRIGRI